MIDAYKKEIQKEFARGRKLTSSSSKYTEKTNTNKVWLCESVGKLKLVGQPEKAKTNELIIHTIADLKSFPSKYRLRMLSILRPRDMARYGVAP